MWPKEGHSFNLDISEEKNENIEPTIYHFLKGFIWFGPQLNAANITSILQMKPVRHGELSKPTWSGSGYT